MIELMFEIDPMHKQRSVPVGRGRVFKATRTRRFENAVGLSAKAQMVARHAEPFDKKSRLKVELMFGLRLRGGRDIDNMAKATLDALNRVVWNDDGQIDELNTQIVASGSAFVRVRVEEISDAWGRKKFREVQERSGVMYGSERFERFVGRTIDRAEIVSRRDGHAGEIGGLRLVFGSEWVVLFDSGQDCCEDRFITCDDDLKDFAGVGLVGWSVAEGLTSSTEVGGQVEESQFLRVETSLGTIVCTTHNIHNGYYGGFSLACETSGDTFKNEWFAK